MQQLEASRVVERLKLAIPQRNARVPVVTIRLSLTAANDGLIVLLESGKQSWRHQAVRGFPVPKVD